MADAQWSEEQFLLRVREPRALAERLNAVLSEENAEPGMAPPEIELNWTGDLYFVKLNLKHKYTSRKNYLKKIKKNLVSYFGASFLSMY